MKTKTGIFVLLIIYSYATCSFQTADKDHIDYFRKINRAESLISYANYEKALAIYSELIDSYPNHFYKDLHNACICALKLKRYEAALSFASALVEHGYELSNFESPAFESFRNQQEYWSQFLSEYPRLRQQYEKKVDIPLRNKYLSLYEIDQQTASTARDVRMGDSVWYELALSLSSLIKEYGFPHWLQNKDTIRHKFYVMIRHYCGLNNRIMNSEELQQDSLYARIMDKNDIPLLTEQALRKGLITPDLYENATTYWNNTNPYGKLALMIDFNTEKVYPFLQAPPEEITEINNRRNNIGLPPIAGEESNNLLYSTWYRSYPFQAIREAFLSCDTCDSLKDFLNIKIQFEKNAKDEYLQQKKETGFILLDGTEIGEFHLKGVMPIVNSKLKKDDIDTQ